MMRLALVGAGSRGTQYCRYAVKRGARIAAVCDPDTRRRDFAGEEFDIPPACRFDSVEALIASGTAFDAAINSTMDRQHVATTLPLLAAHKHVLLEKPICLTKDELFLLYRRAKESDAKVMVCHSLRYTPFYTAIKRRILDGELGRIKHIYASESVGQSHMAAAFIRGKWGNAKACGSKIIMAKCCHDMDLLAWLKSGVRPVKVASMGNLFEFQSGQARPGAGEICVADCAIESECPYSARLNYVTNAQWGVYAWRDILDKGTDLSGKTIAEEDKLDYLASGARFGRCVYRLDNDQYDTQSVIVRFEDGTHAEFGLNGGTPKSDRYIRLEGTHGMLEGTFENQTYVVRRESTRPGQPYEEETVVLDGSLEGHGGGDVRLIDDFLAYCQGEAASISLTSLEDSINGHLIGFGAMESDEDDRFVTLDASAV